MSLPLVAQVVGILATLIGAAVGVTKLLDWWENRQIVVELPRWPSERPGGPLELQGPVAEGTSVSRRPPEPAEPVDRPIQPIQGSVGLPPGSQLRGFMDTFHEERENRRAAEERNRDNQEEFIELRLYHGMDQQTVARLLGVPVITVQFWEGGTIPIPEAILDHMREM